LHTCAEPRRGFIGILSSFRWRTRRGFSVEQRRLAFVRSCTGRGCLRRDLGHREQPRSVAAPAESAARFRPRRYHANTRAFRRIKPMRRIRVGDPNRRPWGEAAPKWRSCCRPRTGLVDSFLPGSCRSMFASLERAPVAQRVCDFCLLNSSDWHAAPPALFRIRKPRSDRTTPGCSRRAAEPLAAST